MEDEVFKNPLANLDHVVSNNYGLSREDGKVVANALLIEFFRLVDFNEERASELSDAFERTDSLQEIVKEFEIDGISEAILRATERKSSKSRTAQQKHDDLSDPGGPGWPAIPVDQDLPFDPDIDHKL